MRGMMMQEDLKEANWGEGVFGKQKEALVSIIVSEKLLESEGILESLTSSLIILCLVFR